MLVARRLPIPFVTMTPMTSHLAAGAASSQVNTYNSDARRVKFISDTALTRPETTEADERLRAAGSGGLLPARPNSGRGRFRRYSESCATPSVVPPSLALNSPVVSSKYQALLAAAVPAVTSLPVPPTVKGLVGTRCM